MIQTFLGFKQALSFSRDAYIVWVLSSFIFFFGGRPFLKGFFDELADKQPGIMTLIAIAIATAYIYSIVVVLGLSGKKIGEIMISRQEVQAMYQSGAGHYDFTTILFRLIGLCMKAYRLLAIKKLSLQHGNYVIDLSCGTG